MGKFTAYYDEYDLTVDLDTNTITILERWKYNWLIHSKGAKDTYGDWTYLEKKDFHSEADKYIWGNWSYKYETVSKIIKESSMNRNSLIGREFHNRKFKIVFDIQWVTSNQHWTANIYKTQFDEDFRSYVSMGYRTINLKFTDLSTNYFESINSIHNTFSHEYAHTLGCEDEYEEKYIGNQEEIDRYNCYYITEGIFEERYRYECDYDSLMNAGNSLRNRFLYEIDKRLDKLFKGDITFDTYLK